jgi:hypothetical protein
MEDFLGMTNIADVLEVGEVFRGRALPGCEDAVRKYFKPGTLGYSPSFF